MAERDDTKELLTEDAIDAALDSGNVVIGLNGNGLVQFQLPAGCSYVVFSADQARACAALLIKHAKRVDRDARRPGPRGT